MGRPKTLVPIPCPSCTTLFQPKNSASKYCSVVCRHAGITKERIERVCPTCKSTFASRWERQVCCSKSCARSHDAVRNGPSNWKGGINKINTGYLKELRKGHPRADRGGYVLQHRLVMEEVLGRLLTGDEHVHHKNGIRDDNRPGNLELWSGRKDPQGQRALDLAHDAVQKLSLEDRLDLAADMLSKLSDTQRRDLLARLSEC